MDQYKCRIEEVVHPLRASERRKNILRRELWSHFCALTDQAGRTDAETAQEALARLGTAEQIQNSFYASIPRMERMAYRFDRGIRRRSGESAVRYAARLSSIAGGMYTVVIVFIVACIELFDREMSPARWSLILMLVGTQVVYASVYLYGLMLKLDSIEARLRRAVLAGKGNVEFSRVAVGVALAGIPLGAVIATGGYAILGSLVGFARSDVLEFLYIVPPLIGFLWLQFAGVIPFAVIRDIQHAKPIPDWPYETAPF